uniref:Serine aminopeptidase S33 domain-containing protein n=1 Tax=Hyaloperonospora arabidopsidis (strain Emoy2) TaxID=559515 RepID=M4B336_HYAAE
MGNGVSSEMEIFADGEMEAELKRLGGTDDASVKQLLGQGYRDVVQLLVRPKRALYDVQELGPERFNVGILNASQKQGLVIMESRRRDFDVMNERGLRVCCSHWQLFKRLCKSNSRSSTSTLAVTPCVVYLHSNIGSRRDALRVRDAALQRGFSVLAFDCCGSGLSDGVYVTMGWNEAMDLVAVLHSVESDASVSELCLYAHSMGVFPAVTNLAARAAGAANLKMQAKLQTLPRALRTAETRQKLKPIRALVLDSAYASIKDVNVGVLREMQDEGFAVPKAVLKVATAAINQSVKKRTGVDIELLRPVDFVELCYAPALFVTANGDRYVSSSQSEELASKYAGPCKLLRVEGAHYDPRDPSTYTQAIDFLYDAMHPRMQNVVASVQ